MAISLCLISCATTEGMQESSTYQPSCTEINAEVNRVYELGSRRAGLVEVFSYLLAPGAAVAMHDARRESERSAEQVLYQLLDLAQLRSCDVAIENPRMPARLQLERMPIGARELECVKPNGVRVYTVYRDLPAIGHRRAEVYSIPPKGPSIVVDKAVSQFPEVVQAFLYERACEAHRQGARLSSRQGIDYSRQLKYNCSAIRTLKDQGILTDEQFPTILEYIKANESSEIMYYVLESKQKIRMADAFRRCFASSEPNP